MKTTNDRFEQLELESNDLDVIVGGAVVFGRVPQPEPGVYVSLARQSLGSGGSATVALGADGSHFGVQDNQRFGMPLAELRESLSAIDRSVATTFGTVCPPAGAASVGGPLGRRFVAHEAGHGVQQGGSEQSTHGFGHGE